MKAVIAIIVVIILAAGAYALFHTSGTPTPTDTMTATTTDMGDMDMSSSTMASTTDQGGTQPVATVTYNGTSFSPASVTIKEGQSVTFVNTSSDPMWVASDPHPLHNGYDGTTRDQHCAAGYTGPAPFDECSTANSFTFTFTKVGTWGYHNHANDSVQGTVIVTQ